MNSSASNFQLPAPRTVFGVPLVPLRVGHALLLHRVRCRMVFGGFQTPAEREGKFPTMRSLLLAVEVCRRVEIRLPWQLRLTWLELCQFRFTELQRLRLEGRFLDGVGEFRAYWRESFHHLPNIWHNDAEERESVGRRLAALKARLIEEMSMSDTEALHTPVARALHDLGICPADGERENGGGNG